MVQEPKPRIIVIEDDLDIARLIRLHLEENGFEVHIHQPQIGAHTGSQSLAP